MYGCESWTIEKAEHQRIDAFGLWCWRRLFRVPWTVRRSNQSILKEISPGSVDLISLLHKPGVEGVVAPEPSLSRLHFPVYTMGLDHSLQGSLQP